MENGPKIGMSAPVASAFLSILLLASWISFWIVMWPPSQLQIGSAIAGVILACIYVLDRIQHWDVRAWKWRDAQRRNYVYPLILYRLIPFGGSLGILSALLINRFVGKEIGYAFIPLFGTYIGLMFAWGFIESCRHILYHRAHT